MNYDRQVLDIDSKSKGNCAHEHIYVSVFRNVLQNALFKPRSHCPGFQPRRRYGVDTGAHRDHAVATPASTALNRDIPC